MIGPGGAAGALSVGRGRFSAKVEVGGGGGADYPNEPAGMTDLAWWQGDSQDSAVNSGDWTAWSNEPDITVVADATSPGPTGSVLEFNYDVGDTSAGLRTADTFANGPVTELYINYKLKMVSPWESSADSKIFFWGAISGSRNNVGNPTQYYMTYQDGPSTALVASQNSAPVTRNMLNIANFWDGLVGTWVNLELHCVSESSPGAADGSLFVYRNGTLIDSNEGTEQWVNSSDPAVGFDGFEWYNKSGHVAGVSRQLRAAELRIKGK